MVQRDHLLPIPAAILLQLGEAASGLSGTRPVSGQHSNPARAGSCWALQDYVVALERVQACCAAPDHSQSVGVGSLWSQPWFVPGQLQNLTSARPPPCQTGVWAQMACHARGWALISSRLAQGHKLFSFSCRPVACLPEVGLFSIQKIDRVHGNWDHATAVVPC